MHRWAKSRLAMQEATNLSVQPKQAYSRAHKNLRVRVGGRGSYLRTLCAQFATNFPDLLSQCWLRVEIFATRVRERSLLLQCASPRPRCCIEIIVPERTVNYSTHARARTARGIHGRAENTKLRNHRDLGFPPLDEDDSGASEINSTASPPKLSSMLRSMRHQKLSSSRHSEGLTRLRASVKTIVRTVAS